MKAQPQSHAFDDPYLKEGIKPDSLLVNKARSPSQYQDGDNMPHSDMGAFKKLPQASKVPSIQYYCITARLNTAFKGHASIWYTEIKEIHGRRSWPWWESQIIQKNSTGTWIWKKTMSFENYKYSVEKDTYEWCLRKSKRLNGIDPQMNIQMRNQKLLTQITGELEKKVKCRCNQSCTLDDIANTLEDLWKRTNMGKYSQFKSSTFKDKQSFRVSSKDKPKGKNAELTKNKNTCHNCGSTDHYANNCPKAKKKVYSIEQVPQEESPVEDSESDSMGDSIREQSENFQEQREEFLVEYQVETQLEIQEMQLEAGMPQDTSNKNLGKHTQHAQKVLVTPTKVLEYMHGTATKMTFCI
ncbi:hypothetical protein O181_029618 [Austropuccinia psidii MF-1]|uniref:CCHC-type domain-containing protein n=1 Tax=Austropuccinia psidii MF-1 TaxID=1389203 RepID=A0A9Q3CTW0_9BASI|nr:hypothetical protein [Austropuccinia psidii MF-1]